MKKMMISTALATSLIAGVASADTKVSAYIETTLGSGETPATSNQTNKVLRLVMSTAYLFQAAKI